jgi:hypothetical protein
MRDRNPARLAPLAGVVFAALTVAGYLAIGPYPGPDSSLSKLTTFYAENHGRVAAGGVLLGLAGIFLALFGAAVWVRIRATDTHPIVAGAALVGTAIAAAGQLDAANAYTIVGEIGHEHAVSPAALQAWHIAGSAGGIAGGEVILLLAVAVAGIAGRGFPRWLAWPALVLALAQLTPFGFFASLLALLWTAIAGIAMVARPVDRDAAGRRSGSAAGRAAPALQEG